MTCLIVDDNEAFVVDFRFRVFEPDATRDRTASDRHQHPIERMDTIELGAFRFYIDLLASRFQFDDFRAKMNAGEAFFGTATEIYKPKRKGAEPVS